MPELLGLLVMASLVFTASPIAAQQQGSTTAENVIQDARASYGPPSPKPKCDTGRGDEIVVCAEEQEQSQFRIRSDDKAKDDYARETMNAGNPPAPDVAGPGIFRGKATMGFGSPPPPVLMIDFSALPDAPEGSDADRISKGLPPLDETRSNAATTGAADNDAPQ
ncbi:MAG: hypothetical protein WAT93_11220 [Pontixanthobacter sp.]